MGVRNVCLYVCNVCLQCAYTYACMHVMYVWVFDVCNACMYVNMDAMHWVVCMYVYVLHVCNAMWCMSVPK